MSPGASRVGVGPWRDWMRQTVTLERVEQVDAAGAKVYGPRTAHLARVEGRHRLVRTAAGAEVTSTHTVYVAGAPAVSPQDRLTLPVGYEPQQPPILAIATYPDERGVMHHVEVYV